MFRLLSLCALAPLVVGCVGEVSVASAPRGSSGPVSVPTGDELLACDDPNTCEYEASCPPVIDPVTLTPCGPGAHCIHRSIAASFEPTMVDRMAECEEPNEVCAPDSIIRTGGLVVAQTCRSDNGVEGRCMTTALPEIAADADDLPRDVCAVGELCAPCFNRNGTPTGYCQLGCDGGAR